MPAPLVQPAMRTVLPPTRQVAAAHFGRVSVVRIACANSRNERVEPRPARATRGIAARILSAGKGTPITPVEHTKTSCGVMPSSAAARTAVARAAVIPAGPTDQFALLEPSLPLRNGSAHGIERGPSRDRARRERGFNRRPFQKISFKNR